jgi:hypothetical protein
MFGGGGSSSPSPAPSPYTPSLADASVVTAGITGLRPLATAPGQSNDFTSIIGGAGGLGRRTDLSGRSLIGGA